MTKFEDFIRGLDPSINLPEGFLSELQSAYQEDISTYQAAVETRDEKIESLTKDYGKINDDLKAAKAKNYDLLMQLPKADSGDGNDAGQFNSEDHNTPDIDDLFGNGEE